MKAITINVSDPVYKTFQEYAKEKDRTASELIREAMELYKAEKIDRKRSIRDLQPISVGRVLMPLSERTDFLEEMLHEDRD